MPENAAFDVFLCHSSSDTEAVERLAQRLEDEAQLRPWLAAWNLVPGEPPQEALELALDGSHTCAVFLGPSGIAPWQNNGIRTTLQDRFSRGGFRVIPVLLPGARKPNRRQLPRFLSRLIWVDFAKDLNDDSAFNRLVAGIRREAPGRHDRSNNHSQDPAGEARSQRRRAFWIILTALMATGSINLIVEIVRRFLSGGSDQFGILRDFVQIPLLVVQASLALLAGGTLVEPSRQWVERLLIRAGLYRDYGVMKRMIISACVLAVVLAARLSLPFVAVYYNNRGTQAVAQNDLSAALYYYQRALSLNPDYAQAHYGLAFVYESLQKYDDAINEYSQSIELNSHFSHARNNLSRLLLRRGKEKDYEDALLMIDEAFKSSPIDTKLQYSLYKNRGWANYELKNYQQAETDLRMALTLRQDGAAAHCLLGYVLEAGKKPSAEEQWEDCVRYEPGENDIEAKWLGYAKEKVMGDGSR